MELIVWMQSFSGPFLNAFFAAVSFLAEDFILAFVLFSYLVGEKRRGRQMALLLLCGLCLNSGVKNLFKVPRPYERPGGVRLLRGAHAGGYSFPSAHTQNTSELFYYLHRWKKTRQTRRLLFLAPFFVALSRMYFGVHSFSDVLAGLLTGILFAALAERFFLFLKRRPEAGLFLLLFPALSLFLALFQNVSESAVRDALVSSGAAAGFILGGYFEEKFVRYNPPVQIVKKIAAVFFSGVFLAALYFGLKRLLGESEVAVFSLYAAVGLAAGCVLPLFLKRIFKT